MHSKTTSNIISLLKQPDTEWQEILEHIIAAYDCTTGSIHIIDRESKLLKLKAQQGIPDFLLPKWLRFLWEKEWQELQLNAANL